MLRKIISIMAISLLVASLAYAELVKDTGDRAERVCNPHSYTDLGNGIVRDNVTGLEWVQDGNIMPSRDPSFDNDDTPGDGKVTWQHAFDYIDQLNADEYLGYSDWRVPAVEELLSLVDMSGDGCILDPVFSNRNTSWSSSIFYGYEEWIDGGAWIVGCCSGAPDVASIGEGGWYYDFLWVRPVRGASYGSSDNLVVNGDGTVTDTDTGLMWQEETAVDVSDAFSWAAAVSYCEDLELGGYGDWRIPTINELESIINYSLYNPATTMPNTLLNFGYWSSTKDAYHPSYRRLVEFSEGFFETYSDYGMPDEVLGHVRAVRGGPCWRDSAECLAHDDCDDGLFCNGQEICDLDATCVDGISPCSGDELCDETTDRCGECIYASDCPEGYLCVSNICTDEQVCQLTFTIDSTPGSLTTTEMSRTMTAAEEMALYVITSITDPITTDCPNQTLEDTWCGCDCCFGWCEESQTAISACIDGTINNFPMSGGDPEPLGTWGVRCETGCVQDSECDDGLFCNGAETCDNGACLTGAVPCALGAVDCDPDEYCDEEGDRCVECFDASDCPDDSLYCTGSPVCTGGVCGFSGDPCGNGEYCDEAGDSCVECLENSHCPDDSLYCTGSPVCAGGVCGFSGDPCSGGTPVCDEAGDRCVECLGDADCDDYCVANICVECRNDADCSDGQFCTGAETCASGACAAGTNPCSGGTPVCDEAGDRCVECLNDTHCPAGYRCTGNVCAPRGTVRADKMTVKAGKTDGTDSIKFTGWMDATEADFIAALGGNLVVSIEAAGIPDPDATTFAFPLTGSTFGNGKYKSPKDPSQSFRFDTGSWAMKFSAKYVDLTGLRCPVFVMIKVGDYVAQVALGEDMVNGTKKPCPLPLMMGVEDILTVDQVKARKGSIYATDSIALKGGFTAAGAFDTGQGVLITLGPDTFIIAGSQFTVSNGIYSCKSAESASGLVTAKFDTVKCKYMIKIKNAVVTGSGNVAFGVDLFGNALQADGPIALPPEF